MSDVTPALFRTRVFERYWVEPLVFDESPLQPALIAEADEWRALGERIGYFVPLKLEPRGFGDVYPELPEAPPWLGAGTFERALHSAQDDLTPERREFLVAMLFEDNASFNLRVGSLRRAIAVLRRTTRRRSRHRDLGRLADQIAWCTAGSESALAPSAQVPFPSAWREGDVGHLSSADDARNAIILELHSELAELMGMTDHLDSEPRPVRRTVELPREPTTLRLQPLGDRLIVELLEEEETTVSGIVLPDTAKEKPQRGRVLAVGPGARDESGEHVAMDLQEGDEVIFSKYGGTEIKLGTDEVLILRESDVLAKVLVGSEQLTPYRDPIERR